MDILTILILPTYKNEIFFPFICILFNFFHECLQVYVRVRVRVLSFNPIPFTSLVKFIPRYFIILDTVLNGIAFLISLSDSWLLVYRNS